jgi:nucleoside-diphosphate-sugar epimerase
MIQNKKILITGGAGFIGSALVEKLYQENEIIVLDILRRNALEKRGLSSQDNVTLIKGDVCDSHAVTKAMKGCNHVIHLASIAGVDTVMKNPVLTMKTALIGTLNLLDAAMEQGNIERFIDFSTSEVFGQFAFNVSEVDVTSLGAVGEARWTYAVSKLATEHLTLNYYKQHGLNACSVRPFNIYGPGQVGEGAIHHFIRRAINNEDLVVHNDGSQIRSWCYIDDIIDGVIEILVKPVAVGQTFNLGNPRSTVTIHNLAQQIIRLANSTSRLVFKPWNFADVALRIPNIDKAKKLLGFKPKIELENGLLRTIEWYRQQENG